MIVVTYAAPPLCQEASGSMYCLRLMDEDPELCAQGLQLVKSGARI